MKQTKKPADKPHHSPQPTVEVIDPRWVLKAFALVVLVAFACGYLTLCFLFWQGQWQLVLHPSRSITATPATVGLPFESVRFGVDAGGTPQLTGWWVPSDSAANPTVLMLHDETGSMSDAVPRLRSLHDARLNVFVFDYAGYGASSGAHPTEALMEANTKAAFDYVTQLRSVPAKNMLVYGRGVGGALATKLCADQPGIEALVLESPLGDFGSQVRHDERARLVPVGLLFQEQFPLADPLHTLATPKLLISYTSGAAPVDLSRAADPKTTVELAVPNDAAAFEQALRRFLGSYVILPPAQLKPD